MPSEIEKADRVDRLRSRLAPLLGLIVLSANQWLFFSRDWNDVSALQMILWVVLILIVFAIIMTGGIWFTPKAVRDIANDEATRNSQHYALKAGFAAAMLTTLMVFIVSPFEPLSAQRAAHIIISVALGVTLVVFGLAESRHLD